MYAIGGVTPGRGIRLRAQNKKAGNRRHVQSGDSDCQFYYWPACGSRILGIVCHQ